MSQIWAKVRSPLEVVKMRDLGILKLRPSFGVEKEPGECFAPYYVGFRIMARERMAKLLKYGHFERRIGHITTYFMTSQISMIMIMKDLSS
mgnify:CR=1 FL=1